MTASNTPRNGLQLVYQIIAAASTIVVGSALALAVVLLAVSLCKHAIAVVSDWSSDDEPLVGEPFDPMADDAPLTCESLDQTAAESINQTMHFTLDSQPPGARLYYQEPVLWKDIDVTPHTQTWVYRVSPDGRDGLWDGNGLDLVRCNGGYQMRLNCVIAKEGYESQILTQVLATISQPNTSNDLPAQLNYTAVLKPMSPPRPVGRAQLVNGRLLEIVPANLDVTKGIYRIDILGPEAEEAP